MLLKTIISIFDQLWKIYLMAGALFFAKASENKRERFILAI